jgi:hypothetical protein
LPPARNFLWRQFHNGGASKISFEPVAFDKNAAPDNFPWLADPLQRPASKRKIHRRLAFTQGFAITIGKCWGGAAPEISSPKQIGRHILRRNGGHAKFYVTIAS